jgi:hypothetical protein
VRQALDAWVTVQRRPVGILLVEILGDEPAVENPVAVVDDHR